MNGMTRLTLVGCRGAGRRRRCLRRAPPMPPTGRASSSGCAPSSAARQRPALPEERPSWLHAPRTESGTMDRERGRSLSAGAHTEAAESLRRRRRDRHFSAAAASRLQIYIRTCTPSILHGRSNCVILGCFFCTASLDWRLLANWVTFVFMSTHRRSNWFSTDLHTDIVQYIDGWRNTQY